AAAAPENAEVVLRLVLPGQGLPAHAGWRRLRAPLDEVIDGVGARLRELLLLVGHETVTSPPAKIPNGKIGCAYTAPVRDGQGAYAAATRGSGNGAPAGAGDARPTHSRASGPGHGRGSRAALRLSRRREQRAGLLARLRDHAAERGAIGGAHAGRPLRRGHGG